MTTTSEPLELVDVDGNRIRFERSPDVDREPRLWVFLPIEDVGWSLEASLTRSDARQLLGWLGRAIDAEPCHLPSCQHLADA